VCQCLAGFTDVRNVSEPVRVAAGLPATELCALNPNLCALGLGECPATSSPEAHPIVLPPGATPQCGPHSVPANETTAAAVGAGGVNGTNGTAAAVCICTDGYTVCCLVIVNFIIIIF
jgi:hypothetical protein